MTSSELDQREGFLVVRRINYFEEPQFRTAPRNAVLSLSHVEVLNRYKGFEGDPWPDELDSTGIQLVDGLAPADQYELVKAYYSKATLSHALCDLIYLQIPGDDRRSARFPHLRFRGCDYGYYVSEFGLFSAIFHDIIYGDYAELRTFAELLNDALLFTSLDDVKMVHKTREDLIETGAALEQDEDETFVPIAIFATLDGLTTNS